MLEGEVIERTVQGRCVIGSLVRVMRGRIVSMDVKGRLKNSILLPTLMYGSETWTWNRAEHSKNHAVEMSYLRGESEITSQDGEINGGGRGTESQLNQDRQTLIERQKEISKKCMKLKGKEQTRRMKDKR